MTMYDYYLVWESLTEAHDEMIFENEGWVSRNILPRLNEVADEIEEILAAMNS